MDGMGDMVVSPNPMALTVTVNPFGVLKGIKLDEYRYVMLVASIMMLHCVITGFIAGSYRKRIFSEEFMQ